MIQPCLFCLCNVDMPEHHLPICFRCRRDVQRAEPEVRMMLSVRAWRALQAQNLNRALAKILRKPLEASDMQHDAMMDVFKPRDN